MKHDGDSQITKNHVVTRFCTTDIKSKGIFNFNYSDCKYVLLEITSDLPCP